MRPRSPLRRRVADVVSYLAVGGLSVVVDVGLLALLVEAFGVPPGVAAGVAFAASVVVNFGLNRLLVAGSRRRGLGRHAMRYALLLGANLVLTVVVVSWAAAVGVSYLAAKIAVVAGSTVWNYLLYRRWVFVQ